jgi:hypothetical protein
MKRDVRDPQVELVRRYARILRSAPAEALRAWDHSTTEPSRSPRTPSRRSRRATGLRAGHPRDARGVTSF